MLRSLRAWLERVPIPDPLRRAQAVTVQVLCFLAIAWALTSVGGFAVRGLLLENAFDVAVVMFGLVPTLSAAIVLLRSGRYGAGLYVGLAGIFVPIALLLVQGVEFSLPRIALVAIPLSAAALLLGRRALWIVFLGAAAVLAVAALRDAGHLGGPGPMHRAVVPLGLFAQAVTTYLVLAIVLDRFGGLLREALAQALRREADLKASEERFRLAFETSPDAMNLVRVSDGVYVAVNDAFVRLSGFAVEEMVGRTSAERDLWVDRTQRRSLMQRLAGGDPIQNVEAEFHRKDGSTFSGLLSAREVTISGTRYVLGIVRDVTDRKRSAQEREALHEQLRQAQKLEAIGRLAGGVAHDFNNVLTSILASAELVKEALGPDHPCREDVLQIDADARRAAELTGQLLSFARKHDAAPQVIRVEDRARSLERMLRRVMGASIAVETAFQAESWPVFIDPGQVEQVILNLAVNARDAMPSGGRLRIVTENVTIPAGSARPGEPAPGDYVLLSVADSGTGMTPEVLAHAFEPFFTTKGSHGTGLGLATCFGIVTQAGGTIAVESTAEAGTRFRIYLPRAAAVVATSGKPQALDLHGSERILVVEDDATVRRLATRSLQQLGYEVVDAGSASEAHAKLAHEPGRVDCLVMDVQLPDGEGRPAAERILTGRGRVPVLFVSGSPDALGSGDPSSEFLAKPYTPIDLARRLRALLARAHRPGESAA
jgi:PAS domain S-box-containing protein